MRIDFTNVEDTQSFVSVPEGTYLCRITDVREGLSRDGSNRWAFRLVVAEGEHAGRTAAWDGLTFSERGLPRAQAVLHRLGFDVRGEIDLGAQELDGLYVRASVIPEEREDPVTGKRVERMRVPYMGYETAEPVG
ncbi:MAG: hypothetical protein ACI8QS_002306 [Planctomycetota bacterium]|jgi:hypothetical protein